MYERILVPLDGSERAAAVLPHVKELASSFGSRVLLLWVVKIDTGDSSPAHDYLDGIRAQLEAAGISARTTVAVGDAAKAILRAADEEGISLVCMSTHGLGGIRRLVLGSVADYVVRQANVPVLLVRASD
jgi:nucleotide-binding universal stress UspA family protein